MSLANTDSNRTQPPHPHQETTYPPTGPKSHKTHDANNHDNRYLDDNINTPHLAESKRPRRDKTPPRQRRYNRATHRLTHDNKDTTTDNTDTTNSNTHRPTNRRPREPKTNKTTRQQQHTTNTTTNQYTTKDSDSSEDDNKFERYFTRTTLQRRRTRQQNPSDTETSEYSETQETTRQNKKTTNQNNSNDSPTTNCQHRHTSTLTSNSSDSDNDTIHTQDSGPDDHNTLITTQTTPTTTQITTQHTQMQTINTPSPIHLHERQNAIIAIPVDNTPVIAQTNATQDNNPTIHCAKAWADLFSKLRHRRPTQPNINTQTP